MSEWSARQGRSRWCCRSIARETQPTSWCSPSERYPRGIPMLRRSARFLTLLVSVAGLITLATTQETKGGRYDQQIQEDVERVLQSNPRFQNVHATTEDAIVTLSGTVKLYIDKLDADPRPHHIR